MALRRGLGRRTALLLAGWTLSFGVVAAALSYASFALMSYDSHEFVMLGRVIGADGAFAAGLSLRLRIALLDRRGAAGSERDPGRPLCLVGFSLQRVEAPIFALVFLVLALIPSTLPREAIIPPLTLFTVMVAGWYEVVAHHVPADGERWLPQAMALVCTLGLATSFALEPDHMLASAKAWGTNLLFLPYWGQSWYAIAVLVMLGFAIEAPPHRRVFTSGVSLSFVLILFLAIGREPYLFSVGDSANHMTLHFLPLLFAYLGLKLVPALSRASSATLLLPFEAGAGCAERGVLSKSNAAGPARGRVPADPLGSPRALAVRARASQGAAS